MQYASAQLFLSLLHNVGLMALVVMAYSTLLRHASSSIGKGVLVGLLFGCAGMFSMLDPIRTPEGIQLDARTVMAALAGPFGGLWAAVIAGAMMSILRMMQGGLGVLAGLIAIAMAAGIGYLFHRLWGRSVPRFDQLAKLALATCLVLTSFVVLPWEVASSVISTAGLPLVTNAIVGIVLLGAFLTREEKLVERETTLKTEASTDELTSLANRRTFDRQAYRVSSGRQGSVFAMLLIDIDRFKSINDRYGHQSGDRVLAEVARIVKQETRGGDLVARYGGEEIAVLMPATSTRVAERVAERVRASVAGQIVWLDGEELSVTVSIGVSGGRTASSVFPSIFKAADEALYDAKNNGRNRVVLRMAA